MCHIQIGQYKIWWPLKNSLNRQIKKVSKVFCCTVLQTTFVLRTCMWLALKITNHFIDYRVCRFDRSLLNYIISSLEDIIIELWCQIHWTYSSTSSSGTSSYAGESAPQILNSMSSVVTFGRLFVNHGGLLNWQHVLVDLQPWPSQRTSSGKSI